jgi:hypothetical protein
MADCPVLSVNPRLDLQQWKAVRIPELAIERFFLANAAEGSVVGVVTLPVNKAVVQALVRLRELVTTAVAVNGSHNGGQLNCSLVGHSGAASGYIGGQRAISCRRPER